MIIVQPVGGLCNRMRVISSALELAKRRKTRLLVIWKCDQDLNAPYEELFEKNREFKVINIKSSKNLLRGMLRKVSRIKITDSLIIDNQKNGELVPEFYEQIKLPAYITTYSQFFKVKDQFKIFTPTPYLQSRIEKVVAEFSENMVGVHIRRTDQIKSIEYSKTENFIELMNQELEKNPNTRFYLATDDMEEEKELRARFPEHIISNKNRVLERDSKDGMYDAVVDLYCLAACQKIIGSYWSSFSTIAAAINSVELIIAGIA